VAISLRMDDWMGGCLAWVESSALVSAGASWTGTASVVGEYRLGWNEVVGQRSGGLGKGNRPWAPGGTGVHISLDGLVGGYGVRPGWE